MKERSIGGVNLYAFCVFALIVFLTCYFEKLPKDMLGGLAITMILGILLGEIGIKSPILKNIGGPAILSIFVPSCMLYYGLLNQNSVDAITFFIKQSNFLYLYISILVVGSILSMKRAILIAGFLKMFIPLFIGTFLAIIVAYLIGSFTNLGGKYAVFYIAIPILSGGVGEGIIPLSVAYSEILANANSTNIIALLAPSAMLGNLFAIAYAGYLKNLALKKPYLSGNGLLVKSKEENINLLNDDTLAFDIKLMGAGLLVAVCYFLIGKLLNMIIAIPAPIIMIIMAAITKLLNIMPKSLEYGANLIYQFVSKNLTWALLVGVGVIYTPWKDVIAAINIAFIVICFSVVTTMVLTGYFCARILNMFEIECSCVMLCHSGLGGTGDVAILGSCNRMELMPFAQISTRIGGACTVIAATFLFSYFGV
ncbi:2-hydroxycarboxylate transporter family protein [Campylobacter canadensis]|uniref:2-hydroxycarboxylate transporter family protein n=1 Tax=Campylobacter canadensis TaxID=449520 RepID=UPI001555B74A|nr:2-hydroxycarboxylate transporter family protein [Campylobacter canadensis]MBZ7994220.1 2-hydroxycarboxylate transporter family protein [Campylobacter canadensis]MBZ7995788.1 2-hydroxycarboxylate transporter family protein [Campylobacter canadensis]MBZ7999552.1 2-hydroxycarboxylate transporter family protein [Campylobacter canadensis]MBZ8001361.1 2-hydroxycarboxylate transporter family protein [Campylobacter canadensis]MBZ8004242.1 2-hydroxycarboxylate transporter family protein [Campylobact